MYISRFKLDWLKDEHIKYKKRTEVNDLPDGPQKEVLIGLHETDVDNNSYSLPIKPSAQDHEFLEHRYNRKSHTYLKIISWWQ